MEGFTDIVQQLFETKGQRLSCLSSRTAADGVVVYRSVWEQLLEEFIVCVGCCSALQFYQQLNRDCKHFVHTGVGLE